MNYNTIRMNLWYKNIENFISECDVYIKLIINSRTPLSMKQSRMNWNLVYFSNNNY